MVTTTFLRHAGFALEADGRRVIIDPFLTGNPAAISPERLPQIDAARLPTVSGTISGTRSPAPSGTGHRSSRRSSSPGSASSLAPRCTPCTSAGGHQFPCGRVKLVPAFHGGVHGDQTGRYPSNRCGGGVTWGGKTVYHCGDTELMLEMQLLAGQVQVDAMLVPLGETYTMGIADAVRVVEFVQPRTVIPMHYNTFDVITDDPADFKRQVGRRAPVVVLESEQAHTLA